MIIQGFLDGLRPEARQTVSEWADAHRWLASSASAEPGPWKTSRVPYLREIMDKLSAHDPTEELVVMKGAQLGFTEAGNNWIGYIMDISPCPFLMVMPTDDTMKRNSKIRIAPLIEASPRLREKVKSPRSRDSGNTQSQKDFPGGVLLMAGANSAAGLRSLPVRCLFLDEVDAYPPDLDGEGSPIELATARTRTFARRKIYKISTPTIEGQSTIADEYESTDQRKYFVPCPHCEFMQPLAWGNLLWEKGKPENAAYGCDNCGTLIEERYKPRMLAAGEWRPTAPEKSSKTRVGYHINSLYSPYGWYSWADAAKAFEEAEGNAAKMKTFVNTVLGETYAEPGESPPWENLYNRREAYKPNTVAKDVCFLTAGVDVQKDRIELEIVGWCRGKISYSIDYRVIMGDTSNTRTWDELAKVVNESWPREDGYTLPLTMMCVDSGYNTQHVYNFCARFDASRVVPVKGQESQPLMLSAPKPVNRSQSGKKIGRLGLWNIGVSVIKSELYGWLRQEKIEGDTPEGYCHFPQYDSHYFKGLTAEAVEFRVVRGYKRYVWVKNYERNEPLDCRVYARAAAAIKGIDRFQESDWQTVGGLLARPKTEKKAPKPSSFWGSR